MMRYPIALAVLATTLVFTPAHAADWCRWRGPNGNGVTDESGWDPQALQGPLRIVWEANVGVGYAAVAVRGDRLWAMGNRERTVGDEKEGMDTVYCLDAATGKEIWRYSYPCTTDEGYPGPTASPIVDGDRLYTIADDTGDLHCFNANDGSVHWRVNVVEAFGAEPPHSGFGYSGSPVVEGNLLLLNLNSAGLALDKSTGKKIWASAPGRCSYSTPVVFDRGDHRRVALFGAHNLFILDPATGQVEASHEWDTFANENSADPLVLGDKIFISSAYDTGCALLRLTPEKGLGLQWQNKALSNLFTSSVVVDGFIYGIDGMRRRNSLRCLDPADGQVKWSQKMDFASLIAADGKLIILTEKGVLHIATASPKSYQEIASATIPRSGRGSRNRAKWWTNPVLANGRLFLRSDKGDLVCLDLRP